MKHAELLHKYAELAEIQTEQHRAARNHLSGQVRQPVVETIDATNETATTEKEKRPTTETQEPLTQPKAAQHQAARSRERNQEKPVERTINATEEPETNQEAETEFNFFPDPAPQHQERSTEHEARDPATLESRSVEDAKPANSNESGKISKNASDTKLPESASTLLPNDEELQTDECRNGGDEVDENVEAQEPSTEHEARDPATLESRSVEDAKPANSNESGKIPKNAPDTERPESASTLLPNDEELQAGERRINGGDEVDEDVESLEPNANNGVDAQTLTVGDKRDEAWGTETRRRRRMKKLAREAATAVMLRHKRKELAKAAATAAKS